MCLRLFLLAFLILINSSLSLCQCMEKQGFYHFPYGDNLYFNMMALMEKSPRSCLLPDFSKITYPELDKLFFNVEVTIEGIKETFIKVKEYRYQLPDIGNYQLYITCDTNGVSYKKGIKREQIFPIFGYLVIHDQLKNEAKYLLIYFKGLGGSGSKRRVFQIDFDGKLLVRDFTEDTTGEHLSANFEIAIGEDGPFVVNKIDFENKIKPSQKIAPITSLPFNANYDPGEMWTKLCKQSTRSYLLPEIKNIRYIPINSLYESKPTIEGYPFEVIFNFRSYQFRFPNIRDKYLYLVSDTTLATYSTKFLEYSRKSGGFPQFFQTHGYLLIYDPIHKTADVLNVYFMMGKWRRTFNIDSGHRLIVSDFENSEDEDNPGEFLANRFLIDLTNLSIRKLTTN
jgi:hypothetical protein